MTRNRRYSGEGILVNTKEQVLLFEKTIKKIIILIKPGNQVDNKYHVPFGVTFLPSITSVSYQGNRQDYDRWK
jgi:hypothetical protein